jgi:hypothetical protein
MKKRVSVNNKGIKNIIKKGFGKNITLSESKIDSIIREYLSERDEFSDNYGEWTEKTSFSPKSVEAINDMVSAMNEILEDLKIIQEKEGDVLIYTDQYADEVIGYYIRDIESLIEDFSDLLEVTKNNEEDKNITDL